MAETAKLALRLFLFAVVAAVALAATNELTKGTIAAREAALSGEGQSEPIQIEQPSDYPAIQSIHRTAEGGHTFLLDAQGFKGPISMALALSAGGSIESLAIISQAETPDLGSKITGEPFLSQFSGRDSLDAIDAISGATVSSKAVISGVEQALSYARQFLAEGADAG